MLKSKNWTQKDLANFFNISQGAVSKWFIKERISDKYWPEFLKLITPYLPLSEPFTEPEISKDSIILEEDEEIFIRAFRNLSIKEKDLIEQIVFMPHKFPFMKELT